QPRAAVEREAEHKKMHRQENRQRQTRNTVDHRRDPQRAAAMFGEGRRAHVNTKATTAWQPRSARTMPRTTAHHPAPRSSSGDHSVRTLRTPIEAWIEAAATNSA